MLLYHKSIQKISTQIAKKKKELVSSTKTKMINRQAQCLKLTEVLLLKFHNDDRLNKCLSKGKVHPRRGHEGPEWGEGKGIRLLLLSPRRYKGVRWSTPRLGRFDSEEDPVPILHEAGLAPEPV